MAIKVEVRASSYEGFDIKVAAMLRGTLWYPEYQIEKKNEIVSHWCTPDTEGRKTEEAAYSWGVVLATDDIRNGLKRIFS